MRGTGKAVLLGMLIAVVLGALYFMALSPKREEASSLKKEITELKASIDQQNQVAEFAEQARREYPTYYGRLVVLGKAVPDQADTASMMVQVNSLANNADVKFEGLKISAGTGTTATATATTTPPPASSTAGTSGTSTTPSPSGSGDSSSSASSTAASTTTPASSPTPATEQSAASLPIGAVVGAAGLPTVPYDLAFQGSFFDTANFLAGIDRLVHLNGARVAADGRLITVDGFALSEPTLEPSPELKVDMAVTSYVTPSEQGLTAGATPSGPAAPSPTQPQTQPASATVSP